MKTKNNNQRFVFPDGSYQDFPNETDQECAIVEQSLDLSRYKYEAGYLVEKTAADIAAEEQAEIARLDTKWKERRKAALMSFELTVFPDSTLTQAQKDNIQRVRQEWMDMTTHPDYPLNFIEPVL